MGEYAETSTLGLKEVSETVANTTDGDFTMAWFELSMPHETAPTIRELRQAVWIMLKKFTETGREEESRGKHTRWRLVGMDSPTQPL